MLLSKMFSGGQYKDGSKAPILLCKPANINCHASVGHIDLSRGAGCLWHGDAFDIFWSLLDYIPFLRY